MRSAEHRARRAEKERERRAAESPACRQSRLASVKAATWRRRQALTLESDITAKRRNSVKKRERRAAESPACRQARLASDKASTRRRRQALTLESDITAKRRNSVKKRERRAIESPDSRQARLASVKAATRRHRQALESSIAENQHMRAEHRRQAAVVAEARCARRDATHNDAFEHLVWFRLPRSYERSPSLSSQERRRLGCS